MTDLWIPHRKRRFEEAIRHLPLEERGKLWVLYHESHTDRLLYAAIQELGERAERLLGVR